MEKLNNPDGDGCSAPRIVKQLATHPLEGIRMKRFYDLSR